MTHAFAERRKAVIQDLKRRRLHCLLVTHPANWYYLTGFTGDAGVLAITPGGTTLITDGRFTVQAGQQCPGIRVEPQKGALFSAVGEWLKANRVAKAGFDPSQWTVAQLNAAQKAAGTKCKAVAAGSIVERLRMKKDPLELALMRRAAILAGEVMDKAIHLLKPGVREADIAAEIEYEMKKRGASGASFETIVASGKRAALPHARPTSKRLKKNELVVLDLGAILAHYCSDMTRTVYLGRAPRRIREWYRAVNQARAAAVAAVKPGITTGEVDAAARDVLKKFGLDTYFVHSTGHGLGLEVHEDPRVARGQAIRLEAGNVITIEPGVYVEDVGGIRIEDDVAVRSSGSEVFTRVTRNLIEL
jgi:Xaa-Pro aminopeptidase